MATKHRLSSLNNLFYTTLLLCCLAIPSQGYSQNNDPATFHLGHSIAREAEDFDSLINNNVGDRSWVSIAEPSANGEPSYTVMQALPDLNTTIPRGTKPKMSYSVDFKESGRYYLWVHLRGPHGGSNSIQVRLNGEKPPGGSAQITFPGDNAWYWIGLLANGNTAYFDISSAGVSEFEIIMREDGTVVDKFLLSKESSFDTALAATSKTVPGEFLVKFNAEKTRDISISKMLTPLGVTSVKFNNLNDTYLVKEVDGQKFDEMTAKQLLAEGKIEYYEPNYIWSISSTPNDTSFSELWGMHNTGQTGGTNDIDIDAPEAWEIKQGAPEVIVGVIDSGVNYLHPDLAANMWVNPNEIAGNGIDDDGNGVVDDIHGFNAVGHNGDPIDQHSHGSHCAGTIGAVGNNNSGVVGVNWNVKIMALRFLDQSGNGTTQGAIEAINYAVEMKARGHNIRVLSNSWGGGGYSDALRDAIRVAGSQNILFVVAAGNDGSDSDSQPVYPASYDVENIMSIAAIDHDGNLARFSNYGAYTVDIAAPGVGILSTVLENHYASYNGTSMATPHVSGVAALLSSAEPTLSPQEVKSRILQTRTRLNRLIGTLLYPGIVSAGNALTNTVAPEPPTDSLPYQKFNTAYNYDSDIGERVMARDDGYDARDLGFDFQYYGQSFSRIGISSNGRLLPLMDDSPIPNWHDYLNRLTQGINIYHDDHVPSNGGGVYFKTTSTVATITWIVKSYAHRAFNNPEHEIRVQVKLFALGRIEFHYKDTNHDDERYDHGTSATIGLATVPGVRGRKLLVSHNTSNQSEIGNGKALAFLVAGETPGLKDFDGDGKSDIVIFRPELGYWFILTSGTNFDYREHKIYQLGLPGDIPLTLDIDGDKLLDLAVWRPASGHWFFRSSTTNYQEISIIQWGLNGDVPYPGDFDGDGTSDIAVYRASASQFYFLLSSSNFDHDSFHYFDFGGVDSIAVPAMDVDADGIDDVITLWELAYIWDAKSLNGDLLYSLPWGTPGDQALGCSVFGEPNPSRTIVRREADDSLGWYSAALSGHVSTSIFGSARDIPSCDKDFDGDGLSDLTVFRDGLWLIKNSQDDSLTEIRFGLPGDIPL